jgi:transglutaminase-like putative cysteine protease
VLSDFDGSDWRPSPVTAIVFGAPARRMADLRLGGEPVAYEVLLEPINLPLLPLLEVTPDRADSAPQLVNYHLTLRSDLQWLTERPITERQRFNARAWPRFESGPRDADDAQTAVMLREMRRLPADVNPRTRAWALRFRDQPRFQGADANALANAVLTEIRNGEFTYTLAPGEYGHDSIDEFWLDRKLGFCEHFAASFVVILRAMGVPARIVTGYQGTDPAPVDGWHIVRQSHAHAWAEYWQAGVGWIRADPTAAVAPDRVSNSRNLQPAPGIVAGALRSMSPEAMLRLRNAWETINSRWNQWVMGYSRIQQFDLLNNLGIRSPDWFDLGLVLAAVVGAAGTAGALWSWLDRRRRDPWQRLHGRICVALATIGVSALAHDPPRRLAQRVRDQAGSSGAELAQALDELDRLRYASNQSLPGRDWWPAFRRKAAALARVRQVDAASHRAALLKSSP